MFNSTKLIAAYCGNQSNALIWNIDLHTFNACFLFTCIEAPVYFFALLILSYLIGNLRTPDELDRLIQNRKSQLTLLILKYLTISIFLICILIDKINYYAIYDQDYNGYVNFIFKLSTMCFLAIYTLKSFKCFNYSTCKLITLNLVLTSLIIIEIVHFNWIQINLRLATLLDKKLVYCFLKLIAIFIYFVLFNFAFFVSKRHSLYYESFANYYDSSFNLDTIVDLSNYRKSFISKLLFNWVHPFLIRASNQQVRNEADIFHLPHTLTSEFVKKRIQITYSKLRDDLVSQTETDLPLSNNETSNLIGQTNENQNESTDQTRQSISTNASNQLIDTNQLITQIKLRTLLWQTYKSELFRVSNLKLIADMVGFLSPILLNKLIDYIDSKDFSADGFLIVVAMLAAQLISSISINLYDFLINNICIKVSSSVVNVIYRKLFSLRTSTLHNNFSNGQLVGH